MTGDIKLSHNKILVLGCYGQVGTSFRKLFGQTKNVFYADLTPKEPGTLACDLSKTDSITNLINKVKPTIIINCAAYTAVDLAEKEKIIAEKINGEAVATLAKEAEKIGAILIHYSTDYVFNGSGNSPWDEQSPTDPINAYGYSKLLGERAALKNCSKAYVYRTQWVYDNDGKNFLNTMLRLAAEREELSVVCDQIGAPTSSDVIARFTLKSLTKIISKKMTPGIYNLVCRGEVSWHGFAEKIFEMAHEFGFNLKIKSVKKITSADYPTPAKRPLNSRLSLKKLEEALGDPLPLWDHELVRIMDARTAREKLN
jgi:dTDP-4-dehydrorhamnose reductase